MFCPLLMPETTRSGFVGSASRRPKRTVSAGKPPTAVDGKAPVVESNVVIWVVVRWSPVPLEFVAGAITVIASCGFVASFCTRATIPAAL
jgi:hypothetical protein